MSGDADRRAVRAGDGVRLQSHPLDVADDGIDLFGPCPGFHDDQHFGEILSGRAAESAIGRAAFRGPASIIDPSTA